MKYFTFYRENNNFDDLLTDPILKKLIDTKIRWRYHLVIGISEENDNEKTFSYMTLKYGDEMKKSLVKDFTPVAGVDYSPKPPKNYKQVIE